MEDAGKVIYYERLNVLITDIAEESNRSPIDEKKLGELLRTLYSEIQLMPADEVRASALLLEVYFSGQNVLCGMQANIEDADKYISTDSLILLLREIGAVLQSSPIDIERLAVLNDELYEQIQYIKFFPAGKILEIVTELYNSVSRLVAELSLKYLPVKATYEKALRCLQTCIDENRFQWSKLLTGFDLVNPMLNRSVGQLTRMFGPPELLDRMSTSGTLHGIFGRPNHPTSWQHWLGTYHSGRFESKLRPIGKQVGRYGLIPTLAEGGYDILVEIGCVECCLHNDDPKSCNLSPHFERIE